MSENSTSLRPPLITGEKTLADITRDICAPMDCRPTALWWAAFIVSVLALILGVVAVWYQIATGIGTWGLNKTVGWAFDITNFVFWVGIGHAGTLISAVLFLFRQKWRTAVNRSAEAMTLFAVMCAGIFPLIHMGRPWLAYWIMVSCNVGVPQLLWFRRVRTCLPVVFVIVIFVNVGMWFERFVIIVTSLYRDFLPSSWAHYSPTLVEIATFIGSFGLFFTCFLLFCRIAPAIAIAEIKGAAHLRKRQASTSVSRENAA